MTFEEREIIELCAKAMGLQIERRYTYHEGLMVIQGKGLVLWNPLENNYQCFSMMVKMKVDPMQGLLTPEGKPCVSTTFPLKGDYGMSNAEVLDGNEEGATRLAICRAVAAIGRAM